MDWRLRGGLVFLGTAGLMFLLLYGYPTALFRVKLIGVRGDVLLSDVSLKTLLHREHSPDGIRTAQTAAVELQPQGWLIAVVCFIGLPLMIAFRSVLQYPRFLSKNDTNTKGGK